MTDTHLDRFELNDATAQAILKSPEVTAALMALAGPIAAQAAASGGIFNTRIVYWGARNAVQIGTGDRKAKLAEAEDRALTRAIGGG